MADYKELLRRAISALPENNGAARRAVYEKARSALVGQLRAITPPLPARDITQHRLQLEDCIRQVEQEASEAVITLGREGALAPRIAPEPPAQPAIVPPAPAPVDLPEPVEPPPIIDTPKPAASIEDIITEAANASGAEVEETSEPVKTAPVEHKSVPSIVARAEATKTGPSSPIPLTSNVRPIDTPMRSPSFETRRDPMPLAANSPSEAVRVPGRIEPGLGHQAAARQQVVAPVALARAEPVETALSSVREVELEVVQPDASEAEGAIERAIETLDREARGEVTETLPDTALAQAEQMFAAPKGSAAAADESGFAEAPAAPRSGAGVTIFLVVFAILLAGAGGAGFWAWREGYVDLDQMFGQAQTTTTETAQTAPVDPAPTLDPVPQIETNTDAASQPGNTAVAPTADPTASLEGLQIEDRLEPTPEPVVPTGAETALPSLSGEESKGEERLPGEDATAVAANDPSASVDPAVLAGSQSLLLEASQDGRTGAVPFSGTVEWSEGVDELGLPTLVGHANIPARNLGVNITIRKNADPSLPASHLMEVDFQVNDTFIGGTIANLPGVLLKDEELVPGTPLVGASARVVGNSFLFALSASANDSTTNTELLENRKWMDLAVVYGTGRNAIITLEKDETAQALFEKVFGTWAQ